MYKVPEDLLQRILEALNGSNNTINNKSNPLLDNSKNVVEENKKLIRIIKDNFLLDGE